MNRSWACRAGVRPRRCAIWWTDMPKWQRGTCGTYLLQSPCVRLSPQDGKVRRYTTEKTKQSRKPYIIFDRYDSFYGWTKSKGLGSLAWMRFDMAYIGLWSCIIMQSSQRTSIIMLIFISPYHALTNISSPQCLNNMLSIFKSSSSNGKHISLTKIYVKNWEVDQIFPDVGQILAKWLSTVCQNVDKFYNFDVLESLTKMLLSLPFSHSLLLLLFPKSWWYGSS